MTAVNTPIHIMGAGIAGLTAALALTQRGFNPRIFEAAPELRPVGAGIVMASNAMQVAKKLGVYDEIRSAGVVLRTFGVADHRGTPLQLTDISAVEKRYGAPSVAIHRGTLQQILLEKLPAGTVETHQRLTALSPTEDGGLEGRFESGKQFSSRLLIGADGLRSATRRLLWGDMPLRYSTHTCWRGIVPWRLDTPGEAKELWGKTGGKRVALIQIDDDRVYFYFTLKKKPGFKVAPADLAAFFREEMKEFPPLYAEVLSAADPGGVYHDDLYDLKRLPVWHKGAALLIGDAAHATTPNLGQGGCQAVEDGYALARELAQGPDAAAAFARYEARRRPRTDYVVNTSYQVGLLSNLGGPVGYPLRNALLKATPESVASAQFDRLFRLELD